MTSNRNSASITTNRPVSAGQTPRISVTSQPPTGNIGFVSSANPYMTNPSAHTRAPDNLIQTAPGKSQSTPGDQLHFQPNLMPSSRSTGIARAQTGGGIERKIGIF